MLYSDPKCKIYIFNGTHYDEFKKAAEIYKKQNNLQNKPLHDIGYAMLFDKIREILNDDKGE